MKRIKDISLIDLMPESIRNDSKIKAVCKALDRELRKINDLTKEILILPRLDSLPESVLDLLAWQWHVDFYEPIGMDIETKRSLIRKSIADHRIKGTPASVETLFANVFNGGKISEWYEYGGNPYHFKISALGRQIASEEQLAEFKHALETTKNVRSWLDEIEVSLSDLLELYIAGTGINLTSIKQRLNLDDESNSSNMSLGFIPFLADKNIIKPEITLKNAELVQNTGFSNILNRKIVQKADPRDVIYHDLRSTALLDLLLVGLGIVREGTPRPIIDYYFNHNIVALNIGSIYGKNLFIELPNSIIDSQLFNIRTSAVIGEIYHRNDKSLADLYMNYPLKIGGILTSSSMYRLTDLDSIPSPSSHRTFNYLFNYILDSISIVTKNLHYSSNLYSESFKSEVYSAAVSGISRVIKLFADELLPDKPTIYKTIVDRLRFAFAELIHSKQYLTPDIDSKFILDISTRMISSQYENRVNTNKLDDMRFVANLYAVPILNSIMSQCFKVLDHYQHIERSEDLPINIGFSNLSAIRLEHTQPAKSTKSDSFTVKIGNIESQRHRIYIESGDDISFDGHGEIQSKFESKISLIPIVSSVIENEPVADRLSSTFSVYTSAVPAVSIYQKVTSDEFIQTDPEHIEIRYDNEFNTRIGISSIKLESVSMKNETSLDFHIPNFLSFYSIKTDRINMRDFESEVYNRMHIFTSSIPISTQYLRFKLRENASDLSINQTLNLNHSIIVNTLEEKKNRSLPSQISINLVENPALLCYNHREIYISEQAPLSYEDSLDLMKITHTRSRITIYSRRLNNGEC